MAVPPRVPPPVGTVAPGDLYVDLATKTIWLGVAASVSAAQAILVSDDIAVGDSTLTSANAYSDAKFGTLAPKASPVFTGDPRGVTVAQTDNDTTLATTAWVTTKINTAIAAIGESLKSGMILLWSGSLAEIGVGDLVGWALCNGANGTPDLRDRFIIGAGNKAVGNKNASTAVADTSNIGDHTHVATGTVLTTAQIPAHSHAAGTLAGSASGNTGADGSHYTSVHYCSANAPAGSTDALLYKDAAAGNVGVSSVFFDVTPNHTHTVNLAVDVTGSTANNTGGGGSHTHAIQGSGGHSHTVSYAELMNAVPYYALAYIMKL